MWTSPPHGGLDAASLKETPSTCEGNVPTALPVKLAVVTGPERLPAHEGLKEMLQGKLRVLQVDSTEVTALFTELSAHVLSIDSQENTIFVRFQTLEEIWKFSTYYTTGFLGQCLENLLLDEQFWLSSLEEDAAIAVSIQEETLQLIYRGILMQEGSFFAVCCADQTFDSSTSGRDLHLRQGDVALFEPPFLGSGWTVLCLSDGARGTAARPELEPVPPFHQWFLKSCAESVLVGTGKPACDLALQFARGACEATGEYEARGPDELSVAPGDRIIIVGLLVSCFHWFTGRKEATGEVGLVRTSLVKPLTDISDSENRVPEEEEWMLFSLQEDKVIEESISFLKKKSQNDTVQNYKLDIFCCQASDSQPSVTSSRGADTRRKHSSDFTATVSACLEASQAEGPRPPRLTVYPTVEGNSSDSFAQLFSFLEGHESKAELDALYGLSSELLASTAFSGHSDEEELISFLAAAREAARKKRLFWSQTRLCFLLGKLCAGRSKFSQARVYYEEALGVPQEGFRDLKLLGSIYSNLAAVYRLQKNTESFFSVMERLAALQLSRPGCPDGPEDDCVLKFILKKAVVSHNEAAEAWACFLLAKRHWTGGAGRAQVAPFLERLLVLSAEAQRPWTFSAGRGYLALARLYGELRLLRLGVSSARRAALHPSAQLSDCLTSLVLVVDHFSRMFGVTDQGRPLPPAAAPFLHRALSLVRAEGGGGSRRHALKHHLSVCLCQLFHQHKMVECAIHQMHGLLNSAAPSQSARLSVPERDGALIWLAWLHIDNSQPDVALDILDSVLASTPEHCTTPQEGVVHNMRGVALRCMGDLQRAAESYQAAADICQEHEDLSNWAVTQANLGLLCLRAGATRLAQSHLVEAVQLFSGLDGDGRETDFVAVLLELGRLYLRQQQVHYGKGCFEWALLLAIQANLLDCQLAATGQLLRLCGSQSPDRKQSIIYSEHQVRLLRHTGDRQQEGDALEAVSQLYLTLGTERAYQAALDNTKGSLGIFIDLGCREKEASGWLEAGKIYHLLGQTELVDLYIQAAQDVGLRTGDATFMLRLLEAAGDIFFNSCRSRDKAIAFYRDCALPVAVTSGSDHARLRLCNKLTEVMLSLKLYEDAVQFAQTALDLSIALGERLNVRVAYHRLAAVFHRLEQHELAEHYYLKTLSHCPAPLRFDEETLYYVRVYQTLGDIMFYDLKDPFDAAGYYHLALAAAMDLGDKRAQLKLCTQLATIYHNFLTDRELSLFFYQRARGFAAELNVRRVDISPEKHLSSVPLYRKV